jgi:hypothetical protein
VRLSGFCARILLLLLVAQVGAVPPTRRMGRDDLHPARVLLRYCVCPGPVARPVAGATTGGDDLDSPAYGSALPPGGLTPWAVTQAARHPAGFLTRPPARLLC